MKLNCQLCIELLLDQNASELDRMAAAESLMWCNSRDAKEALLRIVLNENELKDLRAEASASLGTLWAESKVDYKLIVQIPSIFLKEMLHDFLVSNKEIDYSKLGHRRLEFELLLKKNRSN